MLRILSTYCHFVLTILRILFIRLRTAFAITITAIAILFTQTALATEHTRYVDDNASAGGNGTGWSTAYRVLQDAIEEAETITTQNEDDTVRINVAGGTYFPDRFNDSTTGTGARTATFTLHERVSMFGGYSGSGTTRNPATYVSYLNGDLNEAVEMDDNAYHVVSGSESAITPQNCRLDGFVVCFGVADGTGTNQDKGGGIFLNAADPLIYNCTIFENRATFSGGGIESLNTEDAPEIRNCKIIGNQATNSQGRGGGVNTNRSVTLLNTGLQGNHAGKWGAGLNVEVALEEYDEVTVEVPIANCQFVDNHAPTAGGGMYVSAQGTMTVSNSLFNHNRATSEVSSNGGALWTAGLTVHMKNCTIVHCTIAQDGGEGGGWAIYPGTGGTITNTIFFDNYDGDSVSDMNVNDCYIISYCATKQTLVVPQACQQNPPPYHHNHLFTGNEHPNFVDNGSNPIDNDYRLACGSVCINMGIDSGVALDTYDVDESSSTPSDGPAPDLALQPRLAGADPDENRVDAGCYEKAAVATCTPDIVPYSPCLNGIVNADDLLAVITNWGTCPTTEGACPADVANSDDEVDLDDLLAVINGWGACPGYSGGEEEMPQSIEDCMDYCTNMHDPQYGEQWNDCVNTCVQALCEAEIIECD